MAAAKLPSKEVKPVDGLLTLLILFWVFKAISKKKKGAKPVKKTRTVKPRATAEEIRERAQRAIRMHDELKRREAQKVEQIAMPDMHTHEHAEGESCPPVASGSLQMDSTEGECLCDPLLEHERMAENVPESVYAGEIGREPLLDLSAKGLYQGIVMSEVLKRPGERWRR